MSNHSNQQDPEMAEFVKRQFEQIRKATNLGLGPTGQFPEGKLTQADKGEIKIAITSYQGKVVIDFGSQVTWIGFTPEQAEQMAHSLLEKAAKAKEER
jgi:hypothetical protein